jgi:hypothetical protein
MERSLTKPGLQSRPQATQLTPRRWHRSKQIRQSDTTKNSYHASCSKHKPTEQHRHATSEMKFPKGFADRGKWRPIVFQANGPRSPEATVLLIQVKSPLSVQFFGVLNGRKFTESCRRGSVWLLFIQRWGFVTWCGSRGSRAE